MVAKRGGKAPFVVRAADLDVTVHGTTFDVWLDAEGQPHVRVEEGIVGVARRGEAALELQAQQSFPAQPSDPGKELVVAPPREPAPDTNAVTHDRQRPAHAAPSSMPLGHGPQANAESPKAPYVSPPTPPSSASATPPQSHLREQNDLLWEAAEARRHGDLDRERRALETFDRRFPNAPGSHDARAAALRRAVASGDRAAAREAARAYLAAHPDGPLRREALAVD